MQMIQEGDACECGGVFELPVVENCSCHISPPCSACVNNKLTCDSCGVTAEERDADREMIGADTPAVI